MAVVLWTFVVLGMVNYHNTTLLDLHDQFEDVAELTTFILAVLTIVEIVQAYEGFHIISDSISMKSKRLFFWTIGLITFCVSTMIANVTATLIMLALARRFLPDHKDRMIVGAGIVIASNAGGAWTPIGDVTTSILWIGNRITTWPMMKELFLPSITSMVVTFLILTPMLRGTLANYGKENTRIPIKNSNWVLFFGVVTLVFIPLLHYLTQLPPYMTGMLGVGVMWLVTDIINPNSEKYRVPSILARVDLTTYFFFLGILLSVRALDTAGILRQSEQWLSSAGFSPELVAILLGLLSAIVDNIPLVAASLGMYPTSHFPIDSSFWLLLAYCAGVGGSALIIGSPAGIAYMNQEKVSFGWFAKVITIPVLIGYFAGVLVYMIGLRG
jgi:Na+/H+ antiporter NhaD/arsenite permease-like protein